MAKTKSQSKFAPEEIQIIGEIQAQRGVTRKAAVRYFKKNRSKYIDVIDVKMAAANDHTPLVIGSKSVADSVAKVVKDKTEVKPPARNASAVRKGATYHKMAGSPSKDAVVAVFGKTGYALSWIGRAERLGIGTEELCQQFRDDAALVKKSWDGLTKAATK